MLTVRNQTAKAVLWRGENGLARGQMWQTEGTVPQSLETAMSVPSTARASRTSVTESLNNQIGFGDILLYTFITGIVGNK